MQPLMSALQQTYGRGGLDVADGAAGGQHRRWFGLGGEPALRCRRRWWVGTTSTGYLGPYPADVVATTHPGRWPSR